MRVMLGLLFAAVALAGTSPAFAQDAADGASERPIEAIVPVLHGTAQPATLGPARRGPIGRPRRATRLLVELDIVSACAIAMQQGAPLVRCSNDLPYRTVAPGEPSALAGFEGTSTSRTPRFTVDY